MDYRGVCCELRSVLGLRAVKEVLKLQPRCPVATVPLGAVVWLIYCPGSAVNCTMVKCSYYNYKELLLWSKGAAKPPGPTGTYWNLLESIRGSGALLPVGLAYRGRPKHYSFCSIVFPSTS